MKKIVCICGIMFAMIVVSACTIAEEPVESIEEKVTIVPLPSVIDIESMTDGLFHVSLDEESVLIDESNNPQLRVKVYEQELFDMIDISTLEESSVIRLHGEEVEIISIEWKDNTVLLNGGLEQGGYELRTDEDTVYYEVNYNDAAFYNELGEVTLPVGEEFTFVDIADLDKGEVILNIDELVLDEQQMLYGFVPNNTTIIVENGMITLMTRTYMP